MQLSHEIINWMNKDEKNILKIYQHSPFERNYHNVYNEKKIGNLRERRIPQELYNSHFAINVETSMHPWFFTEKTYKNIIAKIPYLAFGGHYHSAGLKKHLQFERFEEIFDYTAEETPPQNSHPFLIIKGISDNIERLRKEPLSIFDQPTVKEKLDLVTFRDKWVTRWSQDTDVNKTLNDLYLKYFQEPLIVDGKFQDNIKMVHFTYSLNKPHESHLFKHLYT